MKLPTTTYNLQANKGFTLIEVMIYVAIFSIVVGTLTTFALSMNSSRLRAQVMLEVNGQGASIVRTITQTVRNSTAITAPSAGNTAGALTLATSVSGTNPTSFSVTGETLYMTEGALSTVALTNNKVKLTNLVFTNLSRASTPGVVQMRFTLSNTASTTRVEQQYSVDFYGTAARR